MLDLAITLYATSGNPKVSSVEIDYEPVTNIAPNDPVVNNYNDGATTNDNTPTLNFDLSDPDESEEGENIKYQIQIDNDPDFSSPEIDFTEVEFKTSPRTGEEFTPTNLPDGEYYWRIKTIDDEGLESNWKDANKQGFFVRIAFKVDTTLPTSTILYPQNKANLKTVNRII